MSSILPSTMTELTYSIDCDEIIITATFAVDNTIYSTVLTDKRISSSYHMIYDDFKYFIDYTIQNKGYKLDKQDIVCNLIMNDDNSNYITIILEKQID